MSNLIETLWQQFAVEAVEHCDAIEHLLGAVGDDASPDCSNPDGDKRARIAALFRAFHSLKGGSRAMDLFGPETVAHRAETLLGLVRSGQLPLGTDIRDMLLDALDGLRSLIEKAVAGRMDQPAPTELIDRLDEAARPASKPALAMAVPPAPITQPSGPRKGTLHSNERRLTLYVELMRNGMTTLTRALNPDGLDEDGLADVVNTAEQLQTASERMEFGPCAELYHQFGDAVLARDSAGIWRSLRHLVPAARRLGRITGGDTGSDILATLLADHNIQAITADGASLIRMLGDPHAVPSPVGTALGAGFLDLAAGLEIARLTGATTLARRMGETLCSLAQDPPQPVRDGLADILAQLLDSIAANPTNDASADHVAAVDAIRDKLICERRHGDPDSTAFTAEELSDIGLDADMLRFFSPETTIQLRRTLRDEQSHLHIIAARLEEDPSLASRFMQWLGSAVEPITNWPEFSGSTATLKLLIASPMPRDDIVSALRELDPGGQLLMLCSPAVNAPVSLTAPAGGSPAPFADQSPVKRDDAARPPATAAPAPNESGEGHLRVPGVALDRMLERVDGMVRLSGALNLASLDRGPEQILASLAIRLGPEDRNLKRLAEVLERHRRNLAELDQQFSQAIDRLRAATLDLRVVPVAVLMASFPRLIREMARAQGKQIRLLVEGEEVRLDKGTIEALRDPLLHMVRNAVDHGIEPAAERSQIGKPPQATLRITARQAANQVVIEIAEDGRGIHSGKVRERAVANGLLSAQAAQQMPDADIHELIFAPGFSTAAAVTETSGRGVGMDVARNAITRLGGAITIETRPGQGTLFRMALPLTAAMSRCLLIESGEQTLAIPDRHIVEVLTITADNLDDQGTVSFGDQRIPALPLALVLGHPPTQAWPPERGTTLFAVALRHDNGLLAIAVDRLLKRTDLFVRESHPGLAALPGIGGVSMLNDGRIVVILDGDALCRLALAALPVPTECPAPVD